MAENDNDVLNNNDAEQVNNEGKKTVYRKLEVRPAYGEERDGIQSEQRRTIYRRMGETEEKTRDVLAGFRESLQDLTKQVKELVKSFQVLKMNMDLGFRRYTSYMKGFYDDIGRMRRATREHSASVSRFSRDVNVLSRMLRGSAGRLGSFIELVVKEFRGRVRSVGVLDKERLTGLWEDIMADVENDLSRSIRQVYEELMDRVGEIGERDIRNVDRLNRSLLKVISDLTKEIAQSRMSSLEKLFGTALLEGFGKKISQVGIRKTEEVFAVWEEVVREHVREFRQNLKTIYKSLAEKVKEGGTIEVDKLIKELTKGVLDRPFTRLIRETLLGTLRKEVLRGIPIVFSKLTSALARNIARLNLEEIAVDIDKAVLAYLVGPLAEPLWDILGGRYRGGGILGRLYETLSEGVFRRREHAPTFLSRRKYLKEEEIEEEELLPVYRLHGETPLVGQLFPAFDGVGRSYIFSIKEGEFRQERGSELLSDKVVLVVDKEAKVVFERAPFGRGGEDGGWGILDWLGLSYLGQKVRGMWGRFTGIFRRVSPWFVRRFPFLSRVLPKAGLLAPILGLLVSAGLDIYQGGLRGLLFGVKEQSWYERALSGAIKGGSLGAILGTTVFPGLGTKLGALIGAIAGTITHIFGEDIEKTLKSWSMYIKDSVVSLIRGGIAFWEEVWRSLASVGERYIVTPLKGLFEKFVDELRSLSNWLIDNLKSVWRFGAGVVSGVADWVGSLFKGKSERVTTPEERKKVIEQRQRGAGREVKPEEKKLTPPTRRRGVPISQVPEGVMYAPVSLYAEAVSDIVTKPMLEGMTRYIRSIGEVTGVIAALSESTVRSDVIAPDVGGKAYGIFQIHQGIMKSFIDYLRRESPNIAKEFANVTIGSRAFDAKWKEVAQKYGDEFAKAQWGFIYESKYMPLVEKAKEVGIDVSKLGTREFLFSMAVQHGGAKRIVEMAQSEAIRRYGVGLEKLAGDMQLKLLADVRREYVRSLNTLTPRLKETVVRRISREEEMALRLQQTAGYEIEGEAKPVVDAEELGAMLTPAIGLLGNVMKESIELKLEELGRLERVRPTEEKITPVESGTVAGAPKVVGSRGIEDIPIAIDDLGVLLVQLGLV